MKRIQKVLLALFLTVALLPCQSIVANATEPSATVYMDKLTVGERLPAGTIVKISETSSSSLFGLLYLEWETDPQIYNRSSSSSQYALTKDMVVKERRVGKDWFRVYPNTGTAEIPVFVENRSTRLFMLTQSIEDFSAKNDGDEIAITACYFNSKTFVSADLTMTLDNDKTEANKYVCKTLINGVKYGLPSDSNLCISLDEAIQTYAIILGEDDSFREPVFIRTMRKPRRMLRQRPTLRPTPNIR